MIQDNFISKIDQDRQIAKESCEFLDAALVVTSSPIDGIYLDESQSMLLGLAVAKTILQIT
ncbi:MAG: hypothetical protein HY860_01990 [Chlamydiales bacterium]|nr:hypothetical protein [Chlamydiales bacterium]